MGAEGDSTPKGSGALLERQAPTQVPRPTTRERHTYVLWRRALCPSRPRLGT
jgi:hypothetical protein